MNLRISTLKYFRLAILEFLPRLKELKATTQKQDVKEQLEDLIEAYRDIGAKIDSQHLKYDDPNKFYDGEPLDMDFDISDKMIENLSRLSQRLLMVCKQKVERLEKKIHLTEQNKKDKAQLENFIWPLELEVNNKASVIGMYAQKEPLILPGEDSGQSQLYKHIDEQYEATIKAQREQKAKSMVSPLKTPIFPETLVKKLPKDIAVLCDEFNFNYQNDKPNAGMLLLRRILPLSIVRKFQKIGKEKYIKNTTGDFLDTKPLLNKIKSKIANRIYNSIITYKDLLDSSQHSYSLSVHIDDTVRAAEQIRLFLDEIF